MTQITFRKDESVKKDDVYKSHVVSVCSGLPATSISMPPAQRKAGIIRPITSGKLLRAGGPSQIANVSFCLLSSAPNNYLPFHHRNLSLLPEPYQNLNHCRLPEGSLRLQRYLLLQDQYQLFRLLLRHQEAYPRPLLLRLVTALVVQLHHLLPEP